MKDLESRLVTYVEPILRFCMRRLSSREDAECLSQEILVHILEGISRYQVDDLDRWVWQIARNRYARFIESEKRRSTAESLYEWMAFEPFDQDPGREMLLKEEHRAVFSALHSLSSMYRRIVVDYYVHGMSVAAIAEKYGIPQTTVKWRLQSGRTRIKERMGSMDRVYERINWHVMCNGSLDADQYLSTQVARAVCLAAYEKPVTIEEISMATGLPTLYVEDELPRLIYGDAVNDEGKRYSTNFIILRLEDNKRLIGEFPPYVSSIVDMISGFLVAEAESISGIGFVSADSGIEKLGHIIVPLVLRKAFMKIRDTNAELRSGPYPPRKDGGYGWIIVEETEDESETIEPTASGCNQFYDRNRPNAGVYTYLWLGRYFDNELYRQGMGWMYRHDLMKKCPAGRVPDGLLSDDDLARLIRLNLLTRSGDGYRLAIAAFTEAQFRELDRLLNPLAEDLASILDRLALKMRDEFHRFVPKRLEDQINQYVAGYVHNVIGFTVFEMMDKGVLAPPPTKGPLAYGVFHIDRPLDWEV